MSRSYSGLDEDLDGLAVGHRAVAVRDALNVDGAVEDATGFDLPVEDVGQQLIDVRAHRGRAPADGDVLEERRLRERDRVVVRHADATDAAAGTRDLDRGQRRRLGANALEDAVGTGAAGELADALDRLVAALRDDVGGPELAGKVGAVPVAAHDDDLLGAQALGGDDSAQADRAVTDDSDRVARLDAGDDRRVMAGAE